MLNVLIHQGVEVHKLSSGITWNPEMPKFIDLSPYWTDDKNLSINKAHERTGLDKRTLSAAKKGRLDRAQIDTLFKLKDLASELAGRQLTIEDLVRDDVEN